MAGTVYACREIQPQVVTARVWKASCDYFTQRLALPVSDNLRLSVPWSFHTLLAIRLGFDWMLMPERIKRR